MDSSYPRPISNWEVHNDHWTFTTSNIVEKQCFERCRMNDLMFRGSHRTLTPLFSTATAGLTSSKMDNIIALTTQGKLLHDFITFEGGKWEWYENEIGRFGQNSQMAKELTTMLRRRVDTSASPRFPRSTGTWWFGCSSSQPLTASGNNYDGD